MADLLSEKERAIIAAFVPLRADLTTSVITKPSATSKERVVYVGPAGLVEDPAFPKDAVFDAWVLPVSAPLVQATAAQVKSSDWLHSAEQELEQFRKLPQNWDSYGAPTISEEQIKTAKKLIQLFASHGLLRPNLTITAKSHIQLEWHTPVKDVEIEIVGMDRFDISFENTETGTEWEARVHGLNSLESLLPALQSAA